MVLNFVAAAYLSYCSIAPG